MWSASRRKGWVQWRALTAASAAARLWAGSEPMVMCSRLDLFQTGTMEAPSLWARRHVCNWASACRANRSPIPREYLPSGTYWLIGFTIFLIVTVLAARDTVGFLDSIVKL